MNPFRKPCRRLCTSLLVSVCFGSLPLAAQDESVPELFHDQIGVEVINIDVVVTDKKGRLVEGLTRDDFTLRIDGTEVPITNLYAAAAAADAPRMAAAAPMTAAAPTMAAAPPASLQPLDLVVYLDSFYLTPISRQKVLRDLPIFFEEQLAAGARIMLISHAQATRAVTPAFTTDLDELLAAIAKVDEWPALGLRQTIERRFVLTSIQSIYEACQATGDACHSCLGVMVNLARTYSQSVIHERRGATASLSGVVSALSVLEGRKALLYVSDGIQQQPGIDIFTYLGEQLCPQKRQTFQEYYLRHEVGDLNDLVAQANASRVTFYAVEAAGLRNFSSASAEYMTHFYVPSPMNDIIRFANLQGTLHYISHETGGRAIFNANAFARDFSKITDELRTYYSLGYRPEHPGRGISHRVSVKVPKKNYRVRYRRSVLHKKPDQQLADRALGAVLFGTEENLLAAVVKSGAQTPAGDGRVTVPLEVSVPYDKLTLIPEGSTRHGRLTVVIAAPGEKRRKLTLRKKEIAVSLPLKDTGEADGLYRFGVNVDLEAGEYHLAVGIWDEVAATGSFLGVRVLAGAGSVAEAPSGSSL